MDANQGRTLALAGVFYCQEDNSVDKTKKHRNTEPGYVLCHLIKRFSCATVGTDYLVRAKGGLVQSL